jgi:YD repeat-containing protein
MPARAAPSQWLPAVLYGGNSKNAFLTKITRVKDATRTVDLVTDLAYHSTGYLASIRDEGGTFRRFTYDAHGRLSEVRNHGSLLVEVYAYAYSRTSGNGWVYQAASPNRVTTTTYLGTASVETREYLDGLGRPVQTNVRDGSTYHVTATQYDLMGRPWRVWRPYPRTSSAYDASFASNATAHYNTYLSVSNAKPYAETQYTPDPLSRVKKEIPEYTGTSATAFRQYAYTTNATAKQVLTELTDELGKKRRTHTDLFGQDVRIVLGATTADSTATALLHDVVGRRTRATDPRGIQTN